MSGCGVVVGAVRAAVGVTEAQLRHALEQLAEGVFVVLFVSLLAWVVLLAFGVLVHPLACAAVSFVGYYVFSIVRDRRRRRGE